MATDVVSRVTTVIAVVDKASAAVTGIQRKFQSLGQTASAVAGRFQAFAARSGLGRVPGLLHSINERALEVGKSFVEMMLPLVGLGAGGATAAGLVDLGEGLRLFVEEGSRLSVVSERIGVTVGNLQDLEYAASLFKVPAEIMDTNLGRLNRTLAQVAAGKNKEATKLLGFVGIAARDAHHHVRSAADVMPQLADAMARIHNPAQRARLAVGLFGKGGQALIPVLAQGSRGLAAARADMDKLGRMTAAETHEAHELEIAQLRLHRAFDRVQEIIGAALAPYTKKAVDYMRELIVTSRATIEVKVKAWAKEGADAIGTFWTRMKAVDWRGWLTSIRTNVTYYRDLVQSIGGVTGLLKIFLGLLVVDTVVTFGTAIVGLATALWGVAGALATIEAPVYLVIGLLALGGYLVYKHWSKIRAWAATPIDWSGLTKRLLKIPHTIELAFQHLPRAVSAAMDDIAGTLDRAASRLTDNPLMRLLGAWFGIGLPSTVAGLQTPFGGGGYGGAGRSYPEPPATGAYGPYRQGYQYAPTSGSVDVNLNINGAPPGTRATSQTKGRGLRTSMNVGYSMPHLTGVG
jgi:hypothetical protein